MNITKIAVSAALLSVSLSSCVVVDSCGLALVDCAGICVDTNSDENNCGGCNLFCNAGDFCSGGLCIVGSCTPDSSGCAHDYECCSDFCASDGNCGCIPTGNGGCAGNGECCSGNCARDGVCDP